mmetsp:Transcript_27329/g.37538  ORF Transcript_27329/g.37538 Transcript_27329/m.37538 type:complete len:244 (+) Transcript_27329:729-1460(+)
MGSSEGVLVGRVGRAEGVFRGVLVAVEVGGEVGSSDAGRWVGCSVGASMGLPVGSAMGRLVGGARVGLVEGLAEVGPAEGRADGLLREGANEGPREGAADGRRLGAQDGLALDGVGEVGMRVEGRLLAGTAEGHMLGASEGLSGARLMLGPAVSEGTAVDLGMRMLLAGSLEGILERGEGVGFTDLSKTGLELTGSSVSKVGSEEGSSEVGSLVGRTEWVMVGEVERGTDRFLAVGVKLMEGV